MKYKSQYSQDKFLNENFFKNKKNGVFIDIGAHDGITMSNSFFYEKQLGWDGLCVEANPVIFKELKKNRKCLLKNGAAWYENTVKTFRQIEGADMLSGIIDTYEGKHDKRITTHKDGKNSWVDIPVKCFDLTECLIKILAGGAITTIDFLSIDTEGSEYEILKHLDFDRIHIDIILVENNYKNKKLRRLLKSKGYIFYTRLDIDDVFVKNYDDKIQLFLDEKICHRLFANWCYIKQ